MANKRRGHGEGSIYKKSDGRWAAVLNLGYASNGKRRRRYVYGKTKTEVREKLAEIQQQHAAGLLTDTTRVTVAEFLDRWLEDDAKPSVRPSTYDSYQSIVQKHLKPRLGGTRLSKLNAADVQHMHAVLEEYGKAK